MTRRQPRQTLRVLGSALLFLALLPYIFPLYWMVTTAFKSIDAVYADPQQWFPSDPTLGGFRGVIDANLFRAVGNSFVIASGVMLGTLLLTVPAAFALTQFKIRGKSTTITAVLLLQIVPAGMLVIPMFTLMRRLDLVNSFSGVILAIMTLTVPFALVMLRPMYDAFPGDIVEAARIDGASWCRIMWQISLPVLVPAILTVGGISFMFSWGEFVYSLTLLQQDAKWPVTVLMSQQITEVGVAWDRLMAVSVVTAIPLVVLYLFLQRYIREGLTAGAVK